MDDYISRDEIFSVWRSMPKPASIASLTDAINRTPAADVEPVRHGWWDVNRRCSECGYPAPLAYFEPDRWKSLYCPNCGAKMDLEDENNDD
jgi:hypothetical protein